MTMDPRKPVATPDAQAADIARATAYRYLRLATEQGSQAIGCTGASFVLMGIGLWALELAELDAKAASRLLSALATIVDPKKNPRQKAHAEEERKKAVRAILAALDLEMATPKGNG